MKRILLSVLLALTFSTGFADDYTYPYLVLVSDDGTQTALSVEQLELTISDGQLVVTNASGTQSFTLAQLKKMAFSDEVNVVDAINQVKTQVEDSGSADIYTVSGIHLGTFAHIGEAQTTLPKGIYIVKQKDQTHKISVK